MDNSTFNVWSMIIILAYFCLLAFTIWVANAGSATRHAGVSMKEPKNTISTTVAGSEILYGVLASAPCASDDRKCLEWNTFMAGKTVIIER